MIWYTRYDGKEDGQFICRIEAETSRDGTRYFRTGRGSNAEAAKTLARQAALYIDPEATFI